MKVFILCQYIWNGNVLLDSNYTVFSNRELTEKCMNKVKYMNEKENDSQITFPITHKIVEAELYSNEQEVPIFKKIDD